MNYLNFRALLFLFTFDSTNGQKDPILKIVDTLSVDIFVLRQKFETLSIFQQEMGTFFFRSARGLHSEAI